MNSAFVGTSVLLAIAFSEAGGAAMVRRLAMFDTLQASDLITAELRSAFRRERRAMDVTLLEFVRLVIPQRSLTDEIARVLDAGYVCGADCWHLATALYLAPDPGELTFVTLDRRQRDVAQTLGFQV